MLLAFSIAWAPFGGANAVFSDMETTTCTITAGVWYQETDCLEVNPDAARITESGKQIHDIGIGNACSASAITIEEIIVSWEPCSDEEHIHLVQILICEGVEWNGSAISGTELTIDCTIDPGESGNMFLIFDSDMSAKEKITITFIMSDDSEETVCISFET